jgi:hypothetical protein
MSRTKDSIDIANKVSDYIVTATGDCLNNDEREDLHDDLFEKLYEIFKYYDKDTLKELNKNL